MEKEKKKTINSLYLELNKLASKYNMLDENAPDFPRNKLRIYREMSEVSKQMFHTLANYLNSFGNKHIEDLGFNYKYMPSVFYMFLYSIYFVDNDCRGYFREDGRSEGTAKLAYYIIRDCKYANNFGNQNNWLNNFEILEKGISNGIRDIHKTLIQSIARAFVETMYAHREEILAQVPKKQGEFMNVVLSCIYDSNNSYHVYLPFI